MDQSKKRAFSVIDHAINDAGKEFNAVIFKNINKSYLRYSFTEREQKKNRRQIRIRYLDEAPDEDTKNIVMELINSRISGKLCYSDISLCERVARWDNSDSPRDIVVGFATTKLRETVYKNRNKIQEAGGNDIQILDELVAGRIWIWREAIRKFGLHKVDTAYGAVRIMSCTGGKYHVRSFKQYQRFIEREEWLMSLKD